jgi:hypothetical protein
MHQINFNRNAQIDFLVWIHRGAVAIQPIENIVILQFIVSMDGKNLKLLERG